MLGVKFRVIQQGFSLSLGGRASRRGILLGTVQQLLAGLLGGSEHLLGVCAKRCERITPRRLLDVVLFFLQLGLQLQDRVIARLDLLAKTLQRLLRRFE